tara:strand:+ start:6238 stop:7272 length:1035 start_codon:yes stop_codon:yes gene_type:complete
MKKNWLHTFSVNRDVDYTYEVTEKSKRNGKDIKVKKTEQKSRPVLVRLKKPGRKLFDEGELYYGVKLSEGIKAGLLTRALLAKRYQNDGGSMSEPEKERYSELYLKLFEKENELQRLQVNLEKISDDEKKDKITDLLIEMSDLRRDLQDFETSQSALFDQTAETRAKNKTIMWWILQLAQVEKKSEDDKDYYWYHKEKEAKTDEEKEAVAKEKENLEFVDLFPQETLEEKMDAYDSMEDSGDEFYQEALRKLAYFTSYWYSGQADSKEDFQRVEEFLNTEDSVTELGETEEVDDEEDVEEVVDEAKEEPKEEAKEEPSAEDKNSEQSDEAEVIVEPEKEETQIS